MEGELGLSQIKKVLVSIPAFNEEKTLGGVIDEIREVMDKTNYKYSIMVYDDGSTDQTSGIAKSRGCIVFRHKRNMGLAITFMHEIKEAIKLDPDVIVHTDADGQYKATGIPMLINKIEEGHDLVLGSRFRGNIEGMPFSKKLGNKAFAMVLSRMVKTPLTDTTTGFRAFTKEVARNIEFINTFTYTQEQIIKAAKQGFSIAEVPINTKKTRASRLFKSPLQYAVKAWINILRIYRDFHPISFFGVIGTSLISIGLLIGFYFIYLHFTSGIHGHLGLLFLMVILLSTGLQISLFGFLADIIKR